MEQRAGFGDLCVDRYRAPEAWLGLMALTFVGTVFSIYLTALELFVIRAVCAWCLTSAVITALLLITVNSLVENKPAIQTA